MRPENDDYFERMSNPSIESELKKIAEKLTHIICETDDPGIRKTIQVARDHIEETYINKEVKHEENKKEL